MKNIFIKIVSVWLTLCVFLTLFSACISDTEKTDNSNSTPTHICSFDNQIALTKYKSSDATCIKKAKYYFSCDCGKSGAKTFEYGEKSSHIYENEKCKWCYTTKPSTPTEPKTPTTPIQPEDTSRVVYITPTGKRYHYSQSCAGKNAKQTTKNKAEKAGLTGCKNCT